MIERPDWGAGGREMVPAAPIATAVDPLGTNALVAEMEAWPGTDVLPRPATSGPAPASDPAVLHPSDFSQKVKVGAYVGHALVSEMTNTAEGFDANLQFAAQGAQMLEAGFADLGIDAGALNAELAKCPRAMRGKIARMVWKNPGMHPLAFLDRLEREQFTLEEQNLAEQALRKLRSKR